MTSEDKKEKCSREFEAVHEACKGDDHALWTGT